AHRDAKFLEDGNCLLVPPPSRTVQLFAESFQALSTRCRIAAREIGGLPDPLQSVRTNPNPRRGAPDLGTTPCKALQALEGAGKRKAAAQDAARSCQFGEGLKG